MVEARADERVAMAGDRCAACRARSVLPRRHAARPVGKPRRASQRLSRSAREQHVPWLCRRPHHLCRAVPTLAGGKHRRRDADSGNASGIRSVDRRVARRAENAQAAGSRGMRPSVTATVRLTTAQALVRYLAALRTTADGTSTPLFGGVFAIFGHGNVAGIGEALYRHRKALPTYRAHNEQAMAHIAIAYAKAHMRRRMMACTTSIGPGATNLLTAAALAHVNRLPVVFLPGDIFASRAPDPVLQQVENFHDGGVSANDCLRPVSRYFDRIAYPAQLLTALPRAIRVLTDPALCGPVTLALPQDVQTMAYDFPEDLFAPRHVRYAALPPVE